MEDDKQEVNYVGDSEANIREFVERLQSIEDIYGTVILI